MYRFAIKNRIYNDKTVGYLYYEEETQTYKIEIPDDVKSFEAPLILSDFIQKGERKIGNEWSLRWVQGRVVPPERQNIGQILKNNGMKFYSEFPLLVKSQGRCCQDECYIEQVSDYNSEYDFLNK